MRSGGHGSGLVLLPGGVMMREASQPRSQLENADAILDSLKHT
jgi:hypothetical protein